MSTYNENGIVLDKYADVLASLHAEAKSQWGNSINLDKDQYYGHTLDLIADLVDEMNQIIQEINDGRSVQDASGAALDAAVSFIGLERQGNVASTITDTGLQLTASKATTVPAGSLYGIPNTDVVFSTDSDLVFAAAGSQGVNATCTSYGANDAAIGEVTEIKTNISGITAVTNTVAATPGRLRQTDYELKQAHTLAVDTSGDNDVSSIYEALLQVNGVSSVHVFENDTQEQVEAVPAKTIYVVVIGGTDDDIATAINDNKTASVPTFGAESVTVYNDVTSQSKQINFDRGSEISIYVKLNITKVPGKFPDDGEDTIKKEYATLYQSKGLNDDVIYNEHWVPAFSVPGIIVNSMYIGTTDPPTGTVDITMSRKQKPTLDVVRDSATKQITSINVEIVTT